MALAVYSLVVFLVAMVVLLSVWPTKSQEITLNASRTVTVAITGSTYTLGPETLLFVEVVLSGIIGACVYLFYSIADHVAAKGDFDKIWAAWYLLRPPLGAGLALVVSFLIRAGLFTAGSSLTSLNLLGLAAISALAGIFAEHVIRTLKHVADSIFEEGYGNSQSKKKQLSK
jgi:hypothetical protein